jgi:hypothetical protein
VLNFGVKSLLKMSNITNHFQGPTERWIVIHGTWVHRKRQNKPEVTVKEVQRTTSVLKGSLVTRLVLLRKLVIRI